LLGGSGQDIKFLSSLPSTPEHWTDRLRVSMPAFCCLGTGYVGETDAPGYWELRQRRRVNVNQQHGHTHSDRRIDKVFLEGFQAHVLWLVIAVVVLAIIGLFVLSPWSSNDDSGAPALPTPNVAGTPNP
jgi:hypothetical protein